VQTCSKISGKWKQLFYYYLPCFWMHNSNIFTNKHSP